MLLSPHVSKKKSDNSMSKGNTEDGDANRLEEREGWRDWLSRNLDKDVVMGAKEHTKRLAPQSGVVAVQAGAEGPTCHEQLGAGVVVAVGVHGVGEGMNV